MKSCSTRIRLLVGVSLMMLMSFAWAVEAPSPGPTDPVPKPSDPIPSPNQNPCPCRCLPLLRRCHPTLNLHLHEEVTMVNEPTYAESLRLGWSVLWRSVGVFWAVLSAINGWIFWTMPELTEG